MSSLFVGLDVADLTVALCIVDGNGKVVHEATVETTPDAIESALAPYRTAVEAIAQESGPKAPWLHKELSRRAFPIVCLDARLASGDLKLQRNKTDKNDARGIANIVRKGWYGQAYVKSDEALRTRMLLTHRRMLVRSAVRLEMSLRISIKTFGASAKKRGKTLIVTWAPDNAHPTLDSLAQTMLRARDALLAEVKTLDREVVRMARADRVCKLFMTMPGVGPLTAVTVKAAIDDPARFASSRAFGASLGLTPRREQSGQIDVSGRISRIGDESVRSALFDAAMVFLCNSHSQCALRHWALHQRKLKGPRHAAVALARKMAVTLHRMWVTGNEFDNSPIQVS